MHMISGGWARKTRRTNDAPDQALPCVYLNKVFSCRDGLASLP